MHFLISFFGKGGKDSFRLVEGVLYNVEGKISFCAQGFDKVGDVEIICFELGIVPDVSHASEQSVDDLLPIAYACGKPFIATHSNSHALYPHTRNLRDRHFAAIKELGGIVGVSLCPPHLMDTSIRPATAEDVFAHVDYYLSIGGEDMVGFGADWDGTDLPQGFTNVGHLEQVAEVMARHNYSEELIHKLLWKNFYNFAIKNL